MNSSSLTNILKSIPIIYNNAYRFENGLACVKYQNKYGFINKKGETLSLYKDLYKMVKSYEIDPEKVYNSYKKIIDSNFNNNDVINKLLNELKEYIDSNNKSKLLNNLSNSLGIILSPHLLRALVPFYGIQAFLVDLVANH